MPELPEVEVAARNLRRWTRGRRIVAIETERRAGRLFRPASSTSLAPLLGARFRGIQRIGKHLLVTLRARSGPIGLWSHLGMTGKWLRRAGGEPPPAGSRVALQLDDGARLHYVDSRIFGRLRLVDGARFDELPEIAALGPDPLARGIDVPRLRAALGRRRQAIKVALLDQTLLAGIGNIQASESLHRAAIDPRRPARTLAPADVRKMAAGIEKSIAFTLGTFASAGAYPGSADIGYVEERKVQNPFLVYGKAGTRCRRCKGGTILRIVQAGRATFFCPRCQR